MTIQTNVPSIQFTPQGLILPSEQEILNGVLADFNAAFGGGLSQNLETPQGQLASSIAAIIADKNNQIAWLVNNLDPTYSDGIMQDAIAKIYFVKRKGRVNSFATCQFVGLPGVTIPKGLVIKDTTNNEWILDEEISILENGTVEGRVIANGVYGAKANTITKIHQSIIGLDRVTNPQDAVVGTERESRQDFAERYRESVAMNAQGMPSAVHANVMKLEGVIDCYVIDNPTNKTVKHGATGYPIKPHSVYVAVRGGNDLDIAKMIWLYSGNGCDFNGNTEMVFTDYTSFTPKPTYYINFMRPLDTPIFFRVKIKSGLVGDYLNEMKEAIKMQFDQSSHRKIGRIFYAMNYVSSIIKSFPKDYLLDVEVSSDGVNFENKVQLGIDQYPILFSENIILVEE
ncbi:baseplate J/gp47 family protein [Mannheimia haemolytica]|uniref:baseplate J/gp47 family protein n=1 Tax=Mannheimia haemolytica TaxID=75985 RepID=UPI0031F579D7